jgi:hypothetical protein
MAKKSKKKAVAKVIVPRAGPPTNLRPGGFHADQRLEKRAEIKAELRKIEPEDGQPD